MSASGWLQFVAFGVLIAISTPLLGNYMYKVYRGGKAPGDRVFLPVERFVYRVCGIDPEGEQRWTTYAIALLAFSLSGVLLTYILLRLQAHLPLNPDHMKAVPPGLSFTTAVSFLTNTNWQSYSGESTMSHLSQMFALAIQQFLSAAVGMAVVVALIRGLTRRRRRTLGNFWVDMTRSTIRVLLPISFVFAIVLVSQGAIQNFHSSTPVTTVAAQATQSNATSLQQKVPGGPVASMVAIETSVTTAAGSSTPTPRIRTRTPTPSPTSFSIWLVVMIPFALPFTFGKLVGSMPQGWVVFASMAILFVAAVVVLYPLEGNGNVKLSHPSTNVATGVSQSETAASGRAATWRARTSG